MLSWVGGRPDTVWRNMVRFLAGFFYVSEGLVYSFSLTPCVRMWSFSLSLVVFIYIRYSVSLLSHSSTIPSVV
jgi:hypothetical protein